MRYRIPKSLTDDFLKPFEKTKFIQALENVSLEFKQGDRIAMLGENGAGKTTLLKLIAGLLLPTEGSVQINGYDTVKNNDQVRSQIGAVFGNERSFYWRLSGYHNLEFFGKLNNLFGEELENRIHELLALVKLEDAKGSPFRNYSSGMKQRLSIARGLICNPEILILDEPTSRLDPVAKKDIRNLIREHIIQDRTKILLYSTHSFSEAIQLCNHFCIIQNKNIAAQKHLDSIDHSEQKLADYYYQTVGFDVS